MKRIVFIVLYFVFFQNGFSKFFKFQKSVSAYKGYINFYYDVHQDKIFLEVDNLNSEFLYVRSLSEGIGSNDIGLDRGQLGNGVVVRFRKAGNKLLLIQSNLQYRALTSNREEQKSVKEAFAKSVLFGFTIKREKNGKYLVDATDFFIRDVYGVANRLQQSGEGIYTLDISRSAFNLARTKAFPNNVEFDVLLTFTGNPIGDNLFRVAPDASSITVYQHHSFVKLPDNQYKPREYDPRSGCYPLSYLDYATPINQSIKKRFIYRHRLEKKNPTAVISEAKKPIIYYLDRGVPEPVRSALLEGASWWNQAFKAIGYKNAFQVQLLPEGVDPLDTRYNVIQWVHRSTRGWSYGGSIFDPRTGEIIKGHVSLGSLRIRQDFLIAQALQAPYTHNNSDDTFALQMALARIRQLAAHEVGHTLGFTHNFAASTNNRASVMDYPHPKLSIKNNKIDFSEAYAIGIGEWDKVTVAYAYQNFEKEEKKQLQKIITNAFAKGLRFMSDEDARPQGGAHAYAHLWDNGSDLSVELLNVLAVRKKAIENFSAANIKSREPYSVLEDVFVPLYFFHRYQTEAVIKLIGGLEYNYATKGDGQTIVKHIDGKKEREALKTVLKTIAIEEIAIPKRILQLFPPRAMGYARNRESFKSKNGLAFDPYGAVETASEMTLSLLFHPERASRLVQYKSLENNQLGLLELIDAVVEQTFKKDYKNPYYQELQNVVKAQVLNQLFYLAATKNTYQQVNAIVHHKLDEIILWLQHKKSSKSQEIYDKYLLESIKNFKKNPVTFERAVAPKIPDGSPIGME